jgi:Ran GTPase-activating protein (RanGAP) involved in mRNA processing and transport
MRLSEKCLNLLARAIQLSATLTELDISWNELSASSYKELLITLAHSRSLRVVNLSSNTLVEIQD